MSRLATKNKIAVLGFFLAIFICSTGVFASTNNDPSSLFVADVKTPSFSTNVHNFWSAIKRNILGVSSSPTEQKVVTSVLASSPFVSAQSGLTVVSNTPKKVSSKKTTQVSKTSTPSDSTILAIVKRLLGQKEYQDLLRGPKGDSAPSTAMTTSQLVKNTTPISSPAPIPSVFMPVGISQPAPAFNFSGASFFNATDLSSHYFKTGEATVGALTVSGATTMVGNLTVTGNIIGNVVGVINPSFTLGSIPFQGATGLSQDNANFFWNNTTKRLGIGTATPTEKLDVVGNAKVSGTVSLNNIIFSTFGNRSISIGAAIPSSGSDSFFFGLNAGLSSPVSNSNFIGRSSGQGATSANNSNFFGFSAGSGSTNASSSNFFGPNAGTIATNASNSNFFGTDAGHNATNASDSNFFGNLAGLSASGANYSNFFGYGSGVSAANAYNSNFFGYNSGVGATNAYHSNFFGTNSGNTAINANNSNFFGNLAGAGAQNSSYSNLIGYRVGYNPGSNNLGSNNIIIGTNISLPDATANAINIGGILFGTGAYSTTTGDPSITAVSGGRIGIGDMTPSHTLGLEVGGKIGIGDTQVLYLPNQTNLTGSLVVGDGGQNLIHSSGNQGYYNSFFGIGAGSVTTTGFGNTALGYQSLFANIGVGGVNNIYVGGDFASYKGTSATRIVGLNPDSSIDTGFVYGSGFNGEVFTSAVQPDGKVIVGGNFSDYNGTTAHYIVRLNSDGSVDSSFGGFNNAVRSVVIQDDGKILVAGDFTDYVGTTVSHIVRLNSDGSIDTSFATGSGFSDSMYSMALQSDGKVLVGGYATDYDSTTISRIARLNTDGSIDGSFSQGDGFNSAVFSIVIQSNGQIIMGGAFTTYNGDTAVRIVRLNSNGSIDNSFTTGNGFDEQVDSIAMYSTDRVIVGGHFTSYNSTSATRIVGLNPDGSIDTGFVFGSGFNSTVNSIVTQSDGQILIGGAFDDYNGTTAKRIIRLNTDGSVDTSFDSSTGFSNKSAVFTIALNQSGGGDGGNSNTAIGYKSLFSSISGNQNTAIGYNTGLGITTGINNTIIGANVTGLSANLSNNIIIADGEGNQRINVGATGKVGIGTATPTQKLEVAGAIKVNGALNFVAPTNLTAVQTCADGCNYNANGADGSPHNWRVYSYRDINGTIYYSSDYATLTTNFTDDGSSNNYDITVSWTAATGADGYRILSYDPTHSGYNFDAGYDTTGTSFIDDGCGGVCFNNGGGEIVTPTDGDSLAADFTGNVYTKGNFVIRGNSTSDVNFDTGILGSLAFGDADTVHGSYIKAGANNSFAFGNAVGGGYIKSTGVGSFAGGISSNGNAILASGIGSFAFGDDVFGSVHAGGSASVAMGSGVTAVNNYSFAFGTGFTNSIESSFGIGFGSQIFTVDGGTTNVGIGVTSPSSFKLEVAGNIGPEADNTRDLGSGSRRFANVYANNFAGAITPTGFTQGSVVFAGSGGTLAQDNTSLFFDDTNNRLGIGTSTPTHLLEVAGVGYFSGSVLAGGVGPLNSGAVLTVGNGAGTTLTIDKSIASGGTANAWFTGGNVGIGTTTPVGKLHVDGGVVIVDQDIGIDFAGTTAQSFGDNIKSVQSGALTATPYWGFRVTGGDSAGYGSASIPLLDVNAGPLNTVAPLLKLQRNSVTKVLVDNNGNVGIGTTVPHSKLEIDTGTVDDATAYQANIWDSYNTRINGGNLSVFSTGGASTAGDSYQLSFYGRYSNPGQGYQTNKGGYIKGSVITGATISGQPSGQGKLILGTTLTDYSGAITRTDADTMTLTNGNVGIGTASPTEKLNIVGGNLLIGPSSGNYNVTIAAGSIQGTNSGNPNAPFNIQTTGTGVLRLGNSGGVSIGSTGTPLSILDIFGSAAIGSYAGTNAAPSNGLIVSGNVGVGITNPSFPLSFNGSSTGNRIGLFDEGSGTGYGLGIGTGVMQIFADGASTRVGIGYGNSTSFTETLTVKGGNVGIGTVTPGDLLHLNTAAGANPTFKLTDGDVAHGITNYGITTDTVFRVQDWGTTTGGAQVSGLSSANNTPGFAVLGIIGVTDPNDSTPAVLINGSKKNGSAETALDSLETVFQVETGTLGGGTKILTALGNGNVGIGDTTPDYLLDVANTGIDNNIFSLTDSDGECLYNPEAGGVTVSCSSDARLKTNVVDASSALAYFSDFQIRDYNVIASGDATTGVIAQELLLTHPELVSLGADGMYKVDLPNQWKVIKAIQEMDIKIIGINDLAVSNTWRDALVAWFGDIGNGIEKFFSKTVTTENLCVKDSDGETCITRSQLNTLLQNQNSGGGGGGPTTEPTPPPVVGSTDVCPNIDGDQDTVPDGMYIDEQNNCVDNQVTS